MKFEWDSNDGPLGSVRIDGGDKRDVYDVKWYHSADGTTELRVRFVGRPPEPPKESDDG